jgi:hypothetical protein
VRSSLDIRMTLLHEVVDRCLHVVEARTLRAEDVTVL